MRSGNKAYKELNLPSAGGAVKRPSPGCEAIRPIRPSRAALPNAHGYSPWTKPEVRAQAEFWLSPGNIPLENARKSTRFRRHDGEQSLQFRHYLNVRPAHSAEHRLTCRKTGACMEIRFVSSLTGEDENAFAPA